MAGTLPKLSTRHEASRRPLPLRERRKPAKQGIRNSGIPDFRIDGNAFVRIIASTPGIKYALSSAYAAGSPGRIRPYRNRYIRLKQYVALDAHSEREANGREFFEWKAAQFRIAEIGKAEQNVAVRIELDCEPDALTERIEEFDDRYVVDVALTAVGKQAFALFGCQEDYAALLSPVPASAEPVSSERKDRIQSAALLACEVARTMARESSRMTSSQEPM